MRIKKLLVVPCDGLVAPREVRWRAPFLDKAASYLALQLGRSGFAYDGEIQFYGDLPLLLGRENVFIYGRFHPHLYLRSVPKDSPYPSCHGLPESQTVGSREISGVLGGVDAVFVSLRAGARGQEILAEAGRRNIPRAVLDFEDQPEVYGAANIASKITRSYRGGEHFELYFKKELPLGWRTDKTLPLAPTPVRPGSYHFPDAAKRCTIFYSGRSRPGCQADRDEVLALLGELPGTLFLGQDSRRQTFISTRQYWRYLAESRMALSPSGKSWDSFRHCEVGLAPRALLIAPKPYIETAGPVLRDGVNAILYDAEFRAGKYHLVNGHTLMDKIRYYLGRDQERGTLAAAWSRDVLAGHTVRARSRYILESMEQAL